MKICTNTQIEVILRTPLCLDGNSINNVAEMANINLNTLYQWNCSAMRFSPDNIDKLLLYFQVSSAQEEFLRYNHSRFVAEFDAVGQAMVG